MAYNINFLHNVSAAGAGAVYKTEGRDLAVVQVDGSFTSVRIALEGRLIADEGVWERIGVYRAEAPNDTLSVISGSGIYECPIFGLAEIRFTVLSIENGSINIAGLFYDTANGETYPYEEIEGYKMIQMGGNNLFVKGVAEQIFMDPTTGNIVGYDRTATNASVATQVNLQEIVGGMGNRLVGVLPDTVRINGTYESAAFSMETREKIMGGQIAYDAVAAVCEKVTADDSGELTVSQKPAPFYGESNLPDVRVQKYEEITDEPVATFTAEKVAPLDSYVADIKPVQEGSGVPAPDNVRPISGYDSIKVYHTGKNLWGGLTFAQQFEGVYGYTLDTTAKTFTYTRRGTSRGESTIINSGFKPNTRYTIIMTASSVAPNTCLRINYTDNSTVTTVSINNTEKTTRAYVTNANKTVASITLGHVLTGTVTAYYDECGIFEGVLTADDFEPYAGEVLNIALPAEAGTVYGGTLDVTNGTLTVNWGNIASYNGESLPGEWISSMDEYSAGATPTTGAQVVYELASPVVYTLSPMEIEAFEGENAIWGDCGNIQYLKCFIGWETVEADGNIFRVYIRESGVATYTGEAYGVSAKTRKIIGFVPEEGTTYEVTYYTHNTSASMLPVPTMWNPVVMTVQVKYGVYAKQGVGDTTNRGVLKGWLYFIVPRAMLTADAGVNGSQTGTATTDGSWMALTNKAENLPMCTDCDGNSDPMAYYVYVPCGDANESVSAILSIGGGMVLSAGQQKQLPIKLLMPDDTLVQPDFTTLNYTSDDETVATVSNLGIVAGVGTGTTFVNSFFTKDDGTLLSCKTMVVVA